MTTTNHAMPIVKPTTTTHSTSEKDKLIGKPRFHFEPKQVMQLLHARIIGQDAALNRPLAKVVIASSSGLPVQRLS